MIASRIVIRRRETHQFWAGGDRWSPHPNDARTFDHVDDANATAYLELPAPPSDWYADDILALVNVCGSAVAMRVEGVTAR